MVVLRKLHHTYHEAHEAVAVARRSVSVGEVSKRPCGGGVPASWLYLGAHGYVCARVF